LECREEKDEGMGCRVQDDEGIEYREQKDDGMGCREQKGRKEEKWRGRKGGGGRRGKLSDQSKRKLEVH
jgi:hypothetical protein